MDYSTSVHTSRGRNHLSVQIDGEEVTLIEGMSVHEYYEDGDDLMLLTYDGGEVTFDPEEGTLGFGGEFGIVVDIPDEFTDDLARKLEHNIAEKHF